MTICTSLGSSAEPSSKSGKVCVLATSRPVNAAILPALEARTGRRFELIQSPGALNYEALRALAPEFVFFPHWSSRIPPAIFENFECVIFHMTDLPFGRGGSPLQNLIARQIYDTKISAIRCVAEMDAGEVYLKRSLSLYGNAEEIFLRARSIIEDMIVQILKERPVPVPQAGEPVLFKRRTPAQSDLGTVSSLDQAFDLIRMLDADGYPNAFLRVGRLRLEFTRASRKDGCVLADVKIAILPSEEPAAND